jgi:GT2 family glycosyltransferase
LHQTYPHVEIVVVDNASTDESLSIARSAVGKSPIRVVPLAENRGFAGGCNAGVKHARGELIAFLNNDAVAESSWLEALVEGMTSNDVGMCASKILTFEDKVIDKAGHVMYPDGQNRGRGTGEFDRGQYDSPGETFFPDGCAAMYRRRLMEEVEGFDEDFFAYADDADLGVRGRWLGWKCAYVPNAVVHHRHSATLGSYSVQKIYWVERNRLWLAWKNFPVVLLLAGPLFTFNRWLWNLIAALGGRGAAGRFRHHHSLWVLTKTIVKAHVDGLTQLGSLLKKRRRIRRSRRISDTDFLRLLWRFRVSARVLAFRDHL